MSKEKPTISGGIARVVFSKFAKKYLRQYGWFKLKKSIRYAYDTSPFYHKLFKKYHVKPSDIKSFKDMNKIPFTNPEDLQDDPKSFFSVSENKFVKVFTTAGTTGKPKKMYFTKKDLNRLVSSVETGMQLMYNITNRDVIRISFDEGYGIEVWGNRYCLDRAFGRIGAMTISMGKLAVEDELKILREYKPTILTDTSSRINYLTNEMKKIYDLETLGINKILIGAEPTPNAMRKNIENTWNADAFIGYGLTEIGLLSGGECEKKQGMHLSEIDFLAEVVDPKTGEQVEDGEIGELIFTTYDREGMPLIRYRSHDLGKIIPEMCSCGLPLKRIEIKGRTDDMIPVGSGDNIYSRNFDDVLFGMSEVADYQVIFDRKNGKDHLTVVVETELIKETIRKKIFDAVINIPRIKNGVFVSKTIEKPQVELVKQNTLNRKSIKAKRIVDNRNLYD